MPKSKKTSKKVTVRAPKIRGRGDYEDVPKPIARMEAKLDHIKDSLDKAKPSGGAGSMIGRGLGSLIGQGDLGATAGDALAKYFGYGDYDIKTNSLITAVEKGRDVSTVPVFDARGRRGIRITEREYLGDIVSSSTSGAFSVKSYRINPADPNSFPWLSAMAAQFEEWEPMGLIAEFKTTSGTFNGTSQALGAVIMAADYDASDSTPTSKLVMEEMDYSCSTVASNNLRHGFECEPAERPNRLLYTARSAPSTSADTRFSDLCNFFVATSGVTGSSVNLGELWISYDFVFYKKQLTAGQVGDTINTYRTIILHPSNPGFATINTYPFGVLSDAPTAATNVGTVPVRMVGDGTGNFGFKMPTTMTTGTYYYVISFICLGADLASTVSPSITYINARASTAVNTTGRQATSTTRAIYTNTFDVLGPDATLDFTFVFSAGTQISQTYLEVYQMPTNMPVIPFNT